MAIDPTIENVIKMSENHVQVLENTLDFDFDTPDIEDFETNEDDYIYIADESGGAIKYGILGLGQCGGRLAQAFHDLGYKKCIAINTSSHDLADLTIPTKVRIGNTEGAGKNMEVSGEAFHQEKTNILHLFNKIFGRDVEHILVCAGSGGGTGGGTVVQAIELAKVFMAQIGHEFPERKVGAIVTIPTNSEASSPLVRRNALNVLTTLSTMANQKAMSPLIIIDNDKTKLLFPKLTVQQFYPTVNNTIVNLFHTFNLISTKNSDLISFDHADYRTIINSAGHMVMGAVSVRDYSSSEKLSKALRNNIETTLLADNFDLETAEVVGMIVLGGEKIFNTVPGLMSSIEDAFGTMSFLTKATVHRGLYKNNSNSLKVLTLIGGMTEPTRRYRKLIE
jgi:cell division GTPase FtsZ